MSAPISILIPIIGGKDRVQAIKNEMLIESHLDAAIDAFHATQPPAMAEPLISEQPVNPDLQPGDSALLGGELRIQSPWSHD